jgi:hypothetical protein
MSSGKERVANATISRDTGVVDALKNVKPVVNSIMIVARLEPHAKHSNDSYKLLKGK